jgi:NADH dehydrogenase [ubiquinone] 1 alpha subcomplex assembly factor 6
MLQSRNWSLRTLLTLSHRTRHQRSITTGAPSSGPVTADPLGYCRGLVRKHDYESFLTSPCYPRHLRDGYFALKAFSVSRCDATTLLWYGNRLTLHRMLRKVNLAMVQDEVSNPMIGKMQMQFWRDAVKSIADVRMTSHTSRRALTHIWPGQTTEASRRASLA